MKNFLASIFLFFLLLFANLIFAQNDTSAVLNPKILDKNDLNTDKFSQNVQVISASRSAKNLTDLPVTVFVVSGEEIVKNGYTTLVDVLKLVPGIFTSNVTSGELGESFLMRGHIGNYYTKILINSIPIQPSVSGGIAIGEQLPIAQAERIEIIYGPSAAIYGADALAGVINIITKNPETPTFAQATASLGQFGYRYFNFMAGGKTGINKNVLEFSLYGNMGKRDDLNIKKNEQNVYTTLDYFGEYFQIPAQAIEQLRQNPSLYNLTTDMPFYKGTLLKPQINDLRREAYSMGIKLKYRKFQFSFDEMYRQDHSSIGRSPLLFSYANPDTYIGSSIKRWTLSYSNTWKKGMVTVNTSWLRYHLNPLSSVGTNYNNGSNGRSYGFDASEDLFAEVLVNYFMSKELEITSGVSYSQSYALPSINEQSTPFLLTDYKPFSSDKSVVSRPLLGNFGYNPFTFSNLGGFVQAYYNLKKFTFTASARLDLPSHYQGRLYTRGAMIYKLSDKFSIRSVGGYAFKAPSPTFKFSSTAFQASVSKIGSSDRIYFDSVNYEQIPNPNLQPEQLNSTELGIRWQIKPKISLDASIYASNMSQVITNHFVAVDINQYPLAMRGPSNASPQSRQYYNDEKSSEQWIGLQFILRIKDLIPSIRLDSDMFLTYTTGEEALSEGKGTIAALRMSPDWLGQMRLSFQPVKRMYVNLNQVFVSGYYRRYIPSVEAFNDPKSRISGFYNLDIIARYELSKHLRVYTKILNVFDSFYGGIDATGLDIDLKINQQMGRNIQFGISFSTN
jgi:outer membrane cobalamin receptor